MSAFTVGTQTTVKTPEGEPNTSRKPDDEGLGKAFIKWIPGDAIVFYTGILALSAAQEPLRGNETPDELLTHVDAGSAPWFYFALVSASLLVVVGALIPSGVKDRKQISLWALIIRVLLTILAFTMWTTLLPGSWSYTWQFVRDMGVLYIPVLTVVAVVFTAVAQWLTQKTDS